MEGGNVETASACSSSSLGFLLCEIISSFIETTLESGVCVITYC